MTFLKYISCSQVCKGLFDSTPWPPDSYSLAPHKLYFTITSNFRFSGCLILTSFAVCIKSLLSFVLQMFIYFNEDIMIQRLNIRQRHGLVFHLCWYYWILVLIECSYLYLQGGKHHQLLESLTLVAMDFRNSFLVKRKLLSLCTQRMSCFLLSVSMLNHFSIIIKFWI